MPPQDESFTNAMGSVNKKYPVIGKHNIGVTQGSGPYYSEFYPAWEEDNKWNGRPTIELQDKAKGLSTQLTESLLAGESLHHLGGVNPQTGEPVDPYWNQFRNAFKNTLTPQQDSVDRKAYLQDVKTGDTRGYDQWHDVSRLDAYLRGYLFPDENNEWRGSYTRH